MTGPVGGGFEVYGRETDLVDNECVVESDEGVKKV